MDSDEADAGPVAVTASKVGCPGCGVELESGDLSLDKLYYASTVCRRLYDELVAFTQNSGDKEFIQQTAFDSYTAQHLAPKMKPIGGAFALIGLYLVFERGYTGKQVQLAHMVLAKTRRQWPAFTLPKGKASLTAADVVIGLTGDNYRQRINTWAKAVWDLLKPGHERVADLINLYLIIVRR